MPNPYAMPAGSPKPANFSAPPIPRGYPLIGVLPGMLRDPLALSTRLLREHGGIVGLCEWPVRVYMIGHPDYAQYILRDHAANYTKEGGMWDALRLLGGNGLGTIDGEGWRRQRRMMQPAFSRQQVAGLSPLITDTVAQNLATWDAAVGSRQPLDAAPALAQITMRVILKTLFSAAISEAEMMAVYHAVQVGFRYVGHRMWTYFLPSWVPIPGGRRFQESLQVLDRILYRIIGDRRRQPGLARDLLTLLLEARDEVTGQQMSDPQVRDELVGAYIAGYETTATALSWTLSLIAQHPEVQEKLHAEVSGLGGRTPNHGDLGQLSYTRMVFLEAMRLYPPAWAIPRRAIDDDVIGGYRIPKDSVIALHTYAIQRHPDSFMNPDAFHPERFAADSGAGAARCAFLPLGAGARQCIGYHFVLMEAPLIIAMLLQRYRLRPWPGHQVVPEASLALRPRTGVLLGLASAADAPGSVTVAA